MIIINKTNIFLSKKNLWFSKKPYMLYIMPSVILMALLVLVPTIYLYYLSITNYELGEAEYKVIGLLNFYKLFSGNDPEFWHSVLISISFMLIVTTFELVFGFIIAMLLNREFRLKSFAFACLIVPIALTPSIAGQIWKLMYNAEYGIINYIIKGIFGIKIVWLSSKLAFLSIIIADMWQWTPFMALIIYAGLRSMPTEPYESAVVDGANKLQLFKFITLPLLKRLIVLAVIFRSIDSLKLFDVPFVLTQGGPGSATELLSLHIYRLGFAQTGWIGMASATAVVLLIIIMVICQRLIGVMRKGDE